ncbi:MAG: hypothetical protein E6J14_03225 [Chloroflexi bacterium]|nr:MAG: hypothetical protein E6J14_03225 [Chloroflexota bacterium]
MPVIDSRCVMRRSLAAGAAVGAAALSLRALARPLPTEERRLLDWEQVRRVAHARSGERGPTEVDVVGARLGVDYDAVAAQLAPLMAEVCGEPVHGFPSFTVLDRRGFIDRNLVIVRRLIEPVERLRAGLPESRVTALGRGLGSRYLGELLGFLSKRVLGQYDPVLMLAPPALDQTAEPSALYLVEPNVDVFARRHAAPAEPLRRWLILHELTHAWQFEAHPWLRDHLGELMRELLQSELLGRLADAGAGSAGGRSGMSTTSLMRLLPATVRTQLRVASRIQAVMSVLEGYSNFVMHRVGRGHIADFERLERSFHARSVQRPPLERVVLRATGLSMKMRQYELGERFSEAVVRRAGLDTLNRIWEGPAAMPSLDELNSPDRWLARVA